MTTASKLPVIKEETIFNLHLYVALENPQIEDIQAAIKAIESHADFQRGTKFIVSFSDEVEVRRDRSHTLKAKEINVNFFTSNGGTFAYTFHRRSGYPLHHIEYKKITRITYRITKDAESERLEKVQKILNRRYDDQTWTHLTAGDLKYQSTTIVNVKQKFHSYVIEELEKAFENKTAYQYTLYGKKRDLSVSTKMGEDGIFRAWFSSEYAGTGNGQYYLLLNPTTASFCEWD